MLLFTGWFTVIVSALPITEQAARDGLRARNPSEQCLKSLRTQQTLLPM
jgi:hypothetical protein